MLLLLRQEELLQNPNPPTPTHPNSDPRVSNGVFDDFFWGEKAVVLIYNPNHGFLVWVLNLQTFFTDYIPCINRDLYFEPQPYKRQ